MRLLLSVIKKVIQQAELSAQRAEAEKQRAEAEEQKADRLAAKLKELGIGSDQV